MVLLGNRETRRKRINVQLQYGGRHARLSCNLPAGQRPVLWPLCSRSRAGC